MLPRPPLNARGRAGHTRPRSMLSRAPRLVFFVVLASLAALLAACGRGYPPAAKLPDPVPSASVGPGDVIEVVIVGEDKLPKEYEIQPNGTLDFPYSDPVKVTGMEPRQIADKIRDQLVEAKYLVKPQVQVKVKQFNSKKVYVLGAVTKPGPLPFTEGMTLVQAISAGGWFTPLADTNHVQVIRLMGVDKSVNAIFSIDAITDNARPDVKLQQGDTIKVDQRLF